MVASLIVFALGVAAGAATGTGLGAIVGGIIGLHFAAMVYAFVWLRSHLRDVVPTVEPHVVMCFPFGQAAECELVGDLASRRWVDVSRCSVQRLPDHINCDKGCVKMMNLTRVRPGAACACEGAPEPASPGVAQA